MHKTKIIKGLLLISGLLCCSASLRAQETQTPPVQLAANENYRIGPGDVIDITVSKSDILSRSAVRVSNQGTIQLAMLDADTQAACLTERQLAEVIREKYKKFLIEPYVTVAVKEFNSNPVAVMGAVNSPGRFQLQKQLRLVELLTYTNGVSPVAGDTAEIIRDNTRPYCEGEKLVVPNPTAESFIAVNLDQAFKGGLDTNPVIMPGDIIRIAPADQTNAYVQGNVRAAMAIPLKNPVSLTEALAMAGGVTDGAELEKVAVRRLINGSINRELITVNVKDIKAGKRDDMLLQADDLVEVPGPTGAKKVFHSIIKTMVPTMTSLPMRVIY